MGKNKLKNKRKKIPQSENPKSSGIYVISSSDLLRDKNDEGPKMKSITSNAQKRVGPYLSKHKILIVGDGNLSFSQSLAISMVPFFKEILLFQQYHAKKLFINYKI